MIASEPREPRSAQCATPQCTTIDYDLNVAVFVDQAGNATFWSIGTPGADSGCACPTCAPHEQVNE